MTNIQSIKDGPSTVWDIGKPQTVQQTCGVDKPAGTKDADTVPTPKQTTPSSDSLPTLKSPACSIDFISLGSGVPSLGASAMALVTELTDQQRRAMNEQRADESKAIVDKMKTQAKDIRSQAAVNLAMSLTASLIQLGASIYTVKATGTSLKDAAKIQDPGLQAATLQSNNAKIAGYTKMIESGGQAVGSVKDFVSSQFEANMKERDAEIEMLRAYVSQLDSLKDALKEVIQKSIQTQNELQQNTNQTRARILG